MPFEKNMGKNMRSHFSAVFDNNSQTAEIKMYGNIVSKRPYDWWTGKPVEGDFIIGSEVVQKLEELDGCKKLDIRLNSVGGDVHEAILIHNRLRQMAVTKGVQISCSVDGVSMSAGSMIMCAADRVIVTESSLVMIHKSMSLVYGWCNEDQLLQLVEENRKYDKVIAAAYKRKTGKGEEELLKMMSEETYMTGKEAMENGFADELLEGGDKAEIAACADRTALRINGAYFPLMGLKCPEYILSEKAEKPEKPEKEAAITPEAAKGEGDAIENKIKNNDTENKEVNIVAKDLKELRVENPELARVVEEEIKNSLLQQEKAAAEEKAKQAAEKAAKEAVEAERKRLSEIDEIAPIFNAELVEAAKYGDKACTAAELAYRAAKEDASKGADYLQNMKKDTASSNVGKVNSAELPDEIGMGANASGDSKTDEQKMADARDTIGYILKTEVN